MGYSMNDVAGKLKKDVSRLEQLEKGKALPSLKELEDLALKIYKRPLALFFLDHPPTENELTKDFRTLPESYLKKLSPEMRLAVRKGRYMQDVLKEVFDHVNPSEKIITKTLSLDRKTSVIEQAAQLRAFIGISYEDQFQWKNDYTALNSWKEAIEEKGIFIFQFSLELNKARGFSLFDEQFPVIFLNSKDNPKARCFTLLHELSHLLLHSGSIYTGKKIAGDDRQTEKFCDKMAAEVLVPEKLIKLETAPNGVREISSLSNKFMVNPEVIIRRLVDFKMVSPLLYRKYKEQQRERLSKQTNSKIVGGLSSEKKCLNEKGRRFVSIVLNEFDKGNIPLTTISEYLGIKTHQVAKLRSELLK